MSEFQVYDYFPVVIISIRGKLSAEEIADIEAIWNMQISRKPEIIAIYCNELSQLDSAGIGTLVHMFNIAMEKDIRLVFIDLKEGVSNLFKKTSLDSFFTISSKAEFESEYGTFIHSTPSTVQQVYTM